MTGDNSVSQGSIDDVRIYNRALSATEVKQLYNLGAAKIGHSNTIISNGLVGYWTFDGRDTNWSTGQTRDLSGNGNHGSLGRMSTTTSPVSGRIGQGMYFKNTTNDYITAPSFSWPAYSTSTTVALWVKSSGCCSAFTVGNQEPHRFQAHIPFSDNILYFDYGGNSGPARVTANFAAYLNKWTHVVLSVGPNSMKIYLNGMLVSASSASQPTTIALTGLQIGRFDVYNYNGSMDDFRIYNRQLSDNEVMQLYKSGAVTIGHSNAIISDGLVGYWTFDGPSIDWRTNTVADMSGQGNTGTLISMSTTSSPTPGKIGQAFSFNGTSQYLNFGNPSSLTIANAITLSAWEKSTLGNTQQAIINRWGGTHSYMLTKNYAGGGTPNEVTFQLGGTSAVRLDASATLDDGKWHLITATYNGALQAIYVDGALAASQGNTGSINDNEQNVTIGNQLISNDMYFNGQLDDVRIYNRALSAQEVKLLYTAGR